MTMKRPNRGERGQFLVFFSLIIVSVLLLLGVSVDAGRLYFAWTGLSRALDAACAATVRKAAELANDDDALKALAEDVTKYNLQQQGVDIARLAFEATVNHNATVNSLIKIELSGTLQDIPNTFMRFMPALATSDVSARSKCPTCYDNPTPFAITNNTIYEAGMECQQACNDGLFQVPDTETCCEFAFFKSGLNPTQCMCDHQPWMDALTDNCDPYADPPPRVPDNNDMDVDPPQDPVDPGNPDDPGISSAIWVDRPQTNALHAACIDECADRGFFQGVLMCNNGCREATGTVCCKCHCSNDATC